MSIGNPMPLGLATDLANHLRNALKPSCEKIEIAGSIRREKQMVRDVELVALVRESTMKDLFGHSVDVGRTKLDDALDQLHEVAHLGWKPDDRKGGDKLKRLRHGNTGLLCDLYVVTDRRAWGSHIAVRTGPHQFSIHMMKKARELGMFFADGFLLHGHKPHTRGKTGRCRYGPECESIIPLKTEADVFEILKIRYMYPSERERRHGIG